MPNSIVKNIPDLHCAPSNDFHYCPRCGKEKPIIEKNRVLHCSYCGFLFFFNSATAAGAFICYQNQLLLCVRAQDPAKGYLDLPGGFIEFDETVEEGLKREICEELHLNISHFCYITSVPNNYYYAGVLYKTTDLFFISEISSLEGFQPDDDVEDCILICPENIDPTRFAFTSTRTAFSILQRSSFYNKFFLA